MQTRNNNGKYIFVNGEELTRPVYTVTRELVLNDYESFYHLIGKETMNDVFDRNNIPSEFRKVALKVNFPLLLRKTAEDCVTKTRYAIARTKVDGRILIDGLVDGCYFREFLEFRSFPTFANGYEVLHFYKDLKDAGILKKYIYAVADVYGKHQANISTYKYMADIISDTEDLQIVIDMQKLTKEMSLYELQYLIDNTKGILQSLAANELEYRLQSAEAKGSRIKLRI